MKSFALAVFATAFMSVPAIVSLPAMADKLPLPQAAYSADVTFEARGKQFSGHINVDGLKERREVKNPSGRSTTIIIRRDEGKVFDLKPQRNLAVELRLAAAEAAGETGTAGTDVDSFYGTDAATEGTETIAGLQTTKYHIKIDGGPGLTVDAIVWSTDDGIVARVIGKTSIDGDNAPARMELTNLVKGPQDATLFEVPQGMDILSPSSIIDAPIKTPAETGN
jgi:hypothetical protein